ncbi:hypothetical protein [Methylobacterium sp. E-066]|uniref:hypothetical protein n=1 Tax=Methylobacterium sp. E-066 TaxID=2836584 RepID=UPI00391BDBDC
MRPMAQFQDPGACPECGVGAPRTFLRAPAVVSRDPDGRGAYSATEAGEAYLRPASATHPAGCGCCMRRWPLPGALAAGGRVFTSHGRVRREGR